MCIHERDIERFEAHHEGGSNRIWIWHPNSDVTTMWLTEEQARQLTKELKRLYPATTINEDEALDKWAEEHEAEFTGRAD